MEGLDDIDRKMIDALRRDGRMSAPTLAERLSVGRATAYTRLNRLVDSGIIDGFSARVDPAAVGLTVSALVMVNVRQGLWRDLRAELGALPGVEWLGVATGRFDFVLLVRGSSLEYLGKSMACDRRKPSSCSTRPTSATTPSGPERFR
jgi:DNA-binding Lrp family transcriptional regulator